MANPAMDQKIAVLLTMANEVFKKALIRKPTRLYAMYIRKI